MQIQLFNDAGLVLLGHGTTQNENSSAPVFEHAAELRKRHLFAQVREAFWKQSPQLNSVLAEVDAKRVFIVPLFLSEGYFCEQVIPKELGLGVSLDSHSRVLSQGGRQLHYCRPIGTHERMTSVVLARAREVMSQSPCPRPPQTSEVTLLIAGHGTERDRNSRHTVDRQVDLIRDLKIFAGVHAIFLDEEPKISSFHELCNTRDVVIVPFFASDGLHVTEDIPILLGATERLVRQRLMAGVAPWRNPTESYGKVVWYAPAVGSEPLVAEIILERVYEAATWNKCERHS